MLYLIADSNENNSYSFSPSELYVNEDGNCFEETYSTRQMAEQYGDLPIEDTCNGIGHYIENGYWGVDGVIIGERWEAWVEQIKQLTVQ